MLWMTIAIATLSLFVLRWAYALGWSAGFTSAENIWKPHGEELAGVYREAFLEQIERRKEDAENNNKRERRG